MNLIKYNCFFFWLATKNPGFGWGFFLPNNFRQSIIRFLWIHLSSIVMVT